MSLPAIKNLSAFCDILIRPLYLVFYFMISLAVLLELLSIFIFGSIIFVWGVRYNNIKDEFKHFNLPTWLRDLVGIFKLSFAIMLLSDSLDIVRIGASGIAVLMVAALLTHIRLKSPPHKMLPSFSLLCACLIVVYLVSVLGSAT